MKKTKAERLGEVNDQITKIRCIMTSVLEEMLGERTHAFRHDSGIYITDEEECVRLLAKGCTKDEIILEDESTIEYGSVGTDDLHSIVDTVHHDLFVEQPPKRK